MKGIQILLFITLVVTAMSDPGDPNDTCASNEGKCMLSLPCPELYHHDPYHWCFAGQICCLPDGTNHTCARHEGKCMLSLPCPELYHYDQYHFCFAGQICCLPDLVMIG